VVSAGEILFQGLQYIEIFGAALSKTHILYISALRKLVRTACLVVSAGQRGQPAFLLAGAAHSAFIIPNN